jgi:hypothetical protein
MINCMKNGLEKGKSEIHAESAENIKNHSGGEER